MDDIKIISYNCRGLHDTKKRADMFSFLKDRKANIYCLQDLHFTPNMQKTVYTEWNGDCFFSFGDSNSRGVGVFFSKNIDYKIHKSWADTEGNYIVLDITVNSNRFTFK